MRTIERGWRDADKSRIIKIIDTINIRRSNKIILENVQLGHSITEHGCWAVEESRTR